MQETWTLAGKNTLVVSPIPTTLKKVDLVFCSIPRGVETTSIFALVHPWKNKAVDPGEKMVQDLTRKYTKQAMMVIGYITTSGVIPMIHVRDYAHRALYVAPKFRNSPHPFAKMLFDVAKEVDGIPSREITFVASLLLFYLKQGYEIDKLHIPCETQEYYPTYSLNELQKQQIYGALKYTLSQWDISLPFFVELTYTGKNINYEGNDIDITYMQEVINEAKELWRQNGQRTFALWSEQWVKHMEKSLNLGPQNVSMISYIQRIFQR
jgi:hypothetical protein